jgi:DMSO/TMAO reductase YedYZ molybdopterin-dependent catalytic subunit
MTTRRGLFAVFVTATIFASLGIHASAQKPPEPATAARPTSETDSAMRLQVTGEVAHPVTFSADEFGRLPRKTVKAKGHDGVDSQFEGVTLIEILTKAGVPTGKDLRGPAMALYVVIEASDGYRAVFALAELDSAFTDRAIILAERRDGKPLLATQGPLQVIVPGEKKHARWVRQVIRLRVGRA